jgi:hypothetical protein
MRVGSPDPMSIDISGMSLPEIDQRIDKVARLARLWRRQVISLVGQVEDTDQHLADLYDARRRRQIRLVDTTAGNKGSSRR